MEMLASHRFKSCKHHTFIHTYTVILKFVVVKSVMNQSKNIKQACINKSVVVLKPTMAVSLEFYFECNNQPIPVG